jgi:hypothetical protein
MNNEATKAKIVQLQTELLSIQGQLLRVTTAVDTLARELSAAPPTTSAAALPPADSFEQDLRTYQLRYTARRVLQSAVAAGGQLPRDSLGFVLENEATIFGEQQVITIRNDNTPTPHASSWTETDTVRATVHDTTQTGHTVRPNRSPAQAESQQSQLSGVKNARHTKPPPTRNTGRNSRPTRWSSLHEGALLPTLRAPQRHQRERPQQQRPPGGEQRET